MRRGGRRKEGRWGGEGKGYWRGRDIGEGSEGKEREGRGRKGKGGEGIGLPPPCLAP